MVEVDTQLPSSSDDGGDGSGDAAGGFSMPELAAAQGHLLGKHHEATRAILVHICQRLGRLEGVVRTLQGDVQRLGDASERSHRELEAEVTGVQGRVTTLAAQLEGVAAAVQAFQSDMASNRNEVSTLSTTVDEEHKRIDHVTEELENQRDVFDTRFQELNLRLEEIPKALAALQGAGQDPKAGGFTFRSAERDKLTLQQHQGRLDGAARASAGPFTDLQPFTIPEDMRAKIESKIRLKEASKADADRRAASELAEAYRRLQLAGYPRVTEIHMHVEQCREEIKRAFEFTRMSNLQLFACCEAKVEKVDLLSLQSELKGLRKRLREYELHHHRPSPSPSSQVLGPHGGDAPPEAVGAGPLIMGNALSVWNLDKFFHAELGSKSSAAAMVLSPSQIPELRVSLLELARNLNGLRQQWTRKRAHPQQQQSPPQALDPVVRGQLDKLTALVSDAYASLAEEPVDHDRVAGAVQRISTMLASELSQHILTMLAAVTSERRPGGTSGCGGGSDVVAALDRYSRSFTDALVGVGSGTGAKGQKGHTAESRALAEHRRQLDKLHSELAELTSNQRHMDMILKELVAKAATALSLRSLGGGGGGGMMGILGPPSPMTDDRGPDGTEDPGLAALHHLAGQVQFLTDQLVAMRRQFVSEEDFAEVARQVDEWRRERERRPLGGIVGQRMTGAPSPSPTSVLRRNHSGGLAGGGVVFDPGAELALEGGESPAPKSQQPRLDPLQIQRVGPGRLAIAASVPVAPTTTTGRNGMLGKIQMRAQGLRPRSGVPGP